MAYTKNDPVYYHNYYVKNKIKINEKNKAWYDAHPGYKKQANRRYYLTVTKPKLQEKRNAVQNVSASSNSSTARIKESS